MTEDATFLTPAAQQKMQEELEQLKTALGAQLQIAGNTATFVPTSANDANYRVIFETDGTTVVSFRAGKLPEVTNAIGCG